MSGSLRHFELYYTCAWGGFATSRSPRLTALELAPIDNRDRRTGMMIGVGENGDSIEVED